MRKQINIRFRIGYNINPFTTNTYSLVLVNEKIRGTLIEPRYIDEVDLSITPAYEYDNKSFFKEPLRDKNGELLLSDSILSEFRNEINRLLVDGKNYKIIKLEINGIRKHPFPNNIISLHLFSGNDLASSSLSTNLVNDEGMPSRFILVKENIEILNKNLSENNDLKLILSVIDIGKKIFSLKFEVEII